jgi:hypothetical protein
MYKLTLELEQMNWAIVSAQWPRPGQFQKIKISKKYPQNKKNYPINSNTPFIYQL